MKAVAEQRTLGLILAEQVRTANAALALKKQRAVLEINLAIVDKRVNPATQSWMDGSFLHSEFAYAFILDFNNPDDTSILDHLFHGLASFQLLANDSNTYIEMSWARFKAVISQSVLNYVPLKTTKTRKHNPWITRDIIHAKRKVKRPRKSLRAKPTPQILDKLSQAINNINSK